MRPLPNGDLVAGGVFTSAGGIAASNIARWNGAAWSPLGAGITGPSSHVAAIALLPNGDLVAAGYFTAAGGVAANHVARWNGLTWSPLGTGLNTFCNALAVLPNGNLVAAGPFSVAGGTPTGQVARWDGTQWFDLGAGLSSPWGVLCMAIAQNGELVVGGTFPTIGGAQANHVARWNGATWSGFGTGTDGTVFALTELPNGGWIAAGWFGSAGGIAAHRVARWNGANWSALGAGINQPPWAAATAPNGDVLLGGDFHTAGGLTSAYLARLTTTCPALATPAGAGCSGAAGLNVLTAQTLPWLGTTWVATASGMAANSIAVEVLGANSTAIALASLLPQGAPGCTLHAAPDVLVLRLTGSGVFPVQFAIPVSVALIGSTWFEQVVPFELSPSAAIVAVTASNALRLTIGSY